MVVYESPYRVVQMLELIAQTLGANTPVVVARELSKVYEEWLRGPVQEVAATLAARSKVQGEFVLIIDRPCPEQEEEHEPNPYC